MAAKPEKPKKEKKISKNVILPESLWARIDALRHAESRTQSGQIEYMVKKADAQ